MPVKTRGRPSTRKGGVAAARAAAINNIQQKAGITKKNADGTVDKHAWMHDVDVSSGEPMSQEHLRRVYALDRRCVQTVATHRGKLCTDSPSCLVGFYSKPSIRQKVDETLSGSTTGTTGASTSAALCAPRSPSDKGVGLVNQQNTCYMNAVTQMLLRCPRLVRTMLDRSVAEADKKATAALDEFGIPRVFAGLLRSRARAVDTKAMCEALKIDVSEQQDAQEYLALLLHMLSDLHPALRQCILDEFNGNLLYTRTCGECGAVSKKTDKFLFMTAPVAKDADVAECVKMGLAPEELSGASCEKCERSNITMNSVVSVKTLPRYLIVHFLRFQFDVKTCSRKKVGDAVVVTRTLPASAITGNNADTRWYRLRAVVDHLGTTPINGHYTATGVPVSTPVQSDDAGDTPQDATAEEAAAGLGPDEWVVHDDTECSSATPFKAESKKEKEMDGMSFKSKKAYMVLYELVDEDADAAVAAAAAAVQAPTSGLDMRPDLVADLAARDEEALSSASAVAALRTERTAEVTAWAELCDKIFADGTSNASRGARAPASFADVAAGIAMAGEERFFVSEVWLKAFARGAFLGEDSASAKRVVNQPIVCPHGGNTVDPSMPFRVLSAEQWELLRTTLDFDVALPTQSSLCERCARQVVMEKQSGDAELERWRNLQRDLRAGAPHTVIAVDDDDDDDAAETKQQVIDADAEGAGGDSDVEPVASPATATADYAVLVASTSLDCVLELQQPPKPEEAILTDMTAPLVCPHGGVNPTAVSKEVSMAALTTLLEAYHFANSKLFKAGTAAAQPCGECVAERTNQMQSVVSTKNTKFAVKRDLRSLVLGNHENNGPIFKRDLVNYTRNHRKQWEAKKQKEKDEKEAAERAAAEAAEAEAKKAAAAQVGNIKINFKPAKGKSSSAARHADPNSSASLTPEATSPAPQSPAAPSPPADGEDTVADASSSPQPANEAAEEQCPDRRVVHYVVPMSWVEKLDAWMADETHTDVSPPPQAVNCADFVCAHGLSKIGVDDLHPRKRRDGPIGVVVKEPEFEALKTHFTVDPALTFKLVEHNEARILEPRECPECIEARRNEESRAARLFTSGSIKVSGKFKKTKKHSVKVDLTVSNVAHDTTMGAFAGQLASEIFNAYEVFVPPEEITVLFNKLTLDRLQTFSDAGILDGDAVTIEVGDDVVANAKAGNSGGGGEWESIPPELLEQQGRGSTAEAAFQNSALVGRGSAGGAMPAAVKSCPICTFDNPPSAHMCEMCESLL